MGIVFPGCPETFREDSSFRGRSCRRSEGRREEEDEEEDSSQKVRRVRRGDVIAIFAGAAHWWYNDGNEPLQLIAIAHTASPHNQLGRRSYRVSMIPTNNHFQYCLYVIDSLVSLIAD